MPMHLPDDATETEILELAAEQREIATGSDPFRIRYLDLNNPEQVTAWLQLPQTR